jgi:hypothetical protein
MLSAFVAVCFGLLESVTCTVKAKVPAAVGVPEIAPALLSVRPAGSAPALIDHAYGVAPPAARIVAEYDVPTRALAIDVVLTDRGALTTIAKAAVAVRGVGLVESVTCTVKLEVPVAVGVPEIVAPLRLNPAGSAPAVIAHVYGGVPPPAASVAE